MDNGLIILLSILIPVFYLYVYFIFQNKKRKNDSFRYKTDWKNFKKAIDLADQNGIIKYGDLILWNSILDINGLNEMINLIKPFSINNSEIYKLLQFANNKKLDWTSSRY